MNPFGGLGQAASNIGHAIGGGVSAVGHGLATVGGDSLLAARLLKEQSAGLHPMNGPDFAHPGSSYNDFAGGQAWQQPANQIHPQLMHNLIQFLSNQPTQPNIFPAQSISRYTPATNNPVPPTPRY